MPREPFTAPHHPSLADTLFRPDLLARYSANDPRYTSYPTAPQFRESFDTADYRRLSPRRRRPWRRADRAVAVLPHSVLRHRVLLLRLQQGRDKNRAHARPYVERLKREIGLQAACFDTRRPVSQLHWGGGTPTFLSHDEMAELMTATREHFQLLPDDEAEYSIEIDPREASADVITQLMCNLELRFDEFEATYGVRFANTFAPELARLCSFEDDGLISLDARKLEVRMAGRMLVRNLAMVFDRYLGEQTLERFSRTV